jgi:hypothetical protein
MPQRIQLKRTKGWRLPPNCVAVARPTVFGNPFTVAAAREAGCGTHNPDGTRASEAESTRRLAEWCVSLFRRWLSVPNQMDYVGPVAELRKAKLLARLPELRGKDLACWCKPGEPCHADVLLELANRPDSAV